MKKTIIINAIILLACLPLSGLVGWLAQPADIGPRYTGHSTWGMTIHHAFSPVTSGIMTTHDPIQNIILAGPPLLFLLLMVIAAIKMWKWTSVSFSALASFSWVVLAMLAIYARAMP